MNTILTVGLTGDAGVGKDTVAEYLTAMYGFTAVDVAAPFKALAMEGFGLAPCCFRHPAKDKPVLRLCGKTPREFVTELGRNIGMNYPTLTADRMRRKIAAHAKVVFTNLKRPEEFAVVRDAGGFVIRVISPQSGGHQQYFERVAQSEGVDLTISNDGSLADLETYCRTRLPEYGFNNLYVPTV